MLAQLRDFLGSIRELALIAALATVLVFPSQLGAWLAAHGVKKVEAGGVSIDLTQFTATTDAQNTVQRATEALATLPPDSPAVTQAKAALDTAAQRLAQNVARQVREISGKDAAVLPRDGWIYLGTLDAQKTNWRRGVSPTVDAKWPLAPGDSVTLATDTNLHADSATEDRPHSRILSVLPAGTQVQILAVDADRRVPDGDQAAPGFRAWASVRAAL